MARGWACSAGGGRMGIATSPGVPCRLCRGKAWGTMEDFRQVGGCLMSSRLPPSHPCHLLPSPQTCLFPGTPKTALCFNPPTLVCPAGLPRDCQELFEEGERQSGLFQIQPQGSSSFLVNCKMTSGRDALAPQVPQISWAQLSFCQMQLTPPPSLAPCFLLPCWILGTKIQAEPSAC